MGFLVRFFDWLSRQYDLTQNGDTMSSEETVNLNSSVERAKLLDKTAPHEPAAILRAFKQGMVGPGLAKAMTMQPQQAVSALRIAIEERDTAEREGRVIHTDPEIQAVMCKPGEVKGGDKLFDCGREVSYAGSPYNNTVVLHLVGGGTVSFPQHHSLMVIRKKPQA